LFLQLFRENGIELPLKTQGWVKTSLAEIYHSEDYGWSYRYYGRESTVIEGYINKLVDSVEAKHRLLESEKDSPEQQKKKPSMLGELAENKNVVASRQASTTTAKKEQTEL
jgi:hypothetical protein